MSGILEASWRPWTYPRTWTLSPVSAHSRRCVPTFFRTPKPLVFREIGPPCREFFCYALLRLWQCQKHGLAQIWYFRELLFHLHHHHHDHFLVKFTKSDAKRLCWHISLWRNVRKVFRLGFSYSSLVATYTVAIIANYAKVAGFHCGPYLICIWLDGLDRWTPECTRIYMNIKRECVLNRTPRRNLEVLVM